MGEPIASGWDHRLSGVQAGNVLDVEDVRRRVDAAVARFATAKRDQLAQLAPELAPLAEFAAQLLGGGKRLRPAFCWWAWRGCGGADIEAAMVAAAALEFLHAGALIHDDLIDDADTRRGLPAAHRAFASRHRQARGRGRDRDFGQAAAIILGDLCLGWSDELFAAAGLSTAALRAGKPVLDTMRTEVMCGQYLDLLQQVRAERDVTEATPAGSSEESPDELPNDLTSAMAVARFKTAKYTIERPLQLGAALAGADAAAMAQFSEYGIPLGEAFQLRDDILGVFGDPAATGKPAGDDLREGKRTVLIALALDLAPPHRGLVAGTLGNKAASDHDLDQIRQVIIASGALRAAERLIAQRTTQALAGLSRMELSNGAAEVLRRLALVATDRAS